MLGGFDVGGEGETQGTTVKKLRTGEFRVMTAQVIKHMHADTLVRKQGVSNPENQCLTG